MSEAAFLGICFDLVVGFAIWFGLIYLIWKVILVIRKSKNSPSRIKISVAAAIIAVLGASNSIVKEIQIMNRPRVEISAEDKQKIREIVRNVWQDSASLTQENKATFQGILNKYALTETDRKQTKYFFGTLAIQFQKEFYKDALASFTNGRAQKSEERKAVESEILSLGMATKQRINENESLLVKIAAKESVNVDGTDAFLDDTNIGLILESLSGAEKRVNALFEK